MKAPPTAIELAQRDVVRLDREKTKRAEELRAAHAAEAETAKVYDETGTDADLEAASKARLRRERHERLLKSAGDALDEARAKVRALEREALAETFASELDALKNLDDKMAPLVGEILALDRVLDAKILAIARIIVADREAHDVAATHERELGRFGALPPAVSIDDAQLVVQRALAKARATDDRDDLSPWLVSASTDWKVRDMNANALAQHAATIARNEHEASFRNGALVAAAAAVQPTQPPATEH